jgi:hypothetical protein
MAPIIDAFYLLSFTYATAMSTTTSSTRATAVFANILLGRLANAMDLLVPPAVAVQEVPDLKACCFDYLADLLLGHVGTYSSAKLIAAFDHIPATSTYNALIKSSHLSAQICSAFFSVDNLVGLGFRDHVGKPIMTSPITADLASRPPGLFYFAFRSTVTPSYLNSHLCTVNTFTVEFCLALPQMTNPSATTPTYRALFDTNTPPGSPLRCIVLLTTQISLPPPLLIPFTLPL